MTTGSGHRLFLSTRQKHITMSNNQSNSTNFLKSAAMSGSTTTTQNPTTESLLELHKVIKEYNRLGYTEEIIELFLMMFFRYATTEDYCSLNERTRDTLTCYFEQTLILIKDISKH